MTNQEARALLIDAFPKDSAISGPTVCLRRRKRKNYGWSIYADNDGDVRLNGFYSPETLEAIAMWLRDPAAVVNAT